MSTPRPCAICNGARAVPEVVCVVRPNEPIHTEPTGGERPCPGCSAWEERPEPGGGK